MREWNGDTGISARHEVRGGKGGDRGHKREKVREGENSGSEGRTLG